MELLEIKLKNQGLFNVIRETLTRIGTAHVDSRVLVQDCYILRKKGAYYIVHYKELNALDGVHTEVPDECIRKRNHVAVILSNWNILRIKNWTDELKSLRKAIIKDFRVLSHAESKNWKLVSPYKGFIRHY